jgi:glutamyl-tRNA synthetase
MIRTRFAPSPTGYLHIGGARTALFSWLYAKKMGGQFVLRVEDTDLARSTQESVDGLLRDMRWLGLTWDEGPAQDNRGSIGPKGPYFQSQRLDIYAKYLEELKAKGLAYPTFETKLEVEASREAAIADGQAPTGYFEEASPEEVATMAAQGKQPAWRFRIPEGGFTEFEDLVHGKMRFENRLMADFVIVRSDGMPTYNFAASIDDSLMDITHVIRGDDHLSNTPRQVCLYRALGLREPAFAHIPMILGPDKQRLSKRHGATAVGEYEQQGFLPEAMLNFLALLGWSLDDKTTLIKLDDLQQNFSLERVTKHPAVFDNTKLEWMNGQYVKQSDLQRIADLAWPHFVRAGLLKDADREAKRAWFEKLVASLKEKVRTLSLLPDETHFFFKAPGQPSAEALAKFKEALPETWVADFAERLKGVEFNAAALEAASRAYADEKTVKFKHVVGAVRVGLSGMTVTPGLFETLELLGKEESVKRLKASLGWI